MPPTINYKRGDVVLVPFPFSDQPSVKQRPSLVISGDAFQERSPDLLIMAVTSQVRSPLRLGEFIIQDWQGAGLLKPSAVKAAITTVEARLVRRRLGHLSDYDLEQLKKMLQGLLGL
jgi:mRNA interferase MazF